MQWVNFKVALVEFNYARFIFNTFIVGILSMLGTVVTTILAAFAFSRLDFKGRDFMFSVLLMTMMIPGELYTITNYVTVSQLGWINTRYALVIPFMTSVFYIFFLRQSFKQIPDTLYRAAQVDGCGDFKYLARVMIPIAKPTITTITILSAIGAWDAYIWPQLVAPAEENWLISVALRSPQFQIGEEGRPLYHLQLAAAAIVTIPLLIVFFTLKKYIMAGVGRSGTKG
jgi:ABC-type glycerol-3-phosphate transport system permease component